MGIDCASSNPKPSPMQTPRAETNADHSHRGTSKIDAMRAYVDTLRKADALFVKADDAKIAKLQAAAAASPKTNDVVITTMATTHGRPTPPVPPIVELIITKKASSPPHTTSNVMHGPAIMGCGALVGIGLGGFLFVSLSWSALLFLTLAMSGIGGLIGAVVLAWDENGLLGILPQFVTDLLLNTTLLEFILDDKMLVSFKEFAVQILPVMLAHDEKRMMEALSNMSPELRQQLTTKGMVRLLSTRMQTVLLPRVLRKQMAQPPTYRLPDNIKVADPTILRRVVSDHSTDRDLNSARSQFRRLFAEFVSKKNVDLILGTLDARRLQTLSVGLGLLTMSQLIAFSDSRKFLLGFIRGAILLATMSGASVSAVLLLVWIGAKQHKKQMGW